MRKLTLGAALATCTLGMVGTLGMSLPAQAATDVPPPAQTAPNAAQPGKPEAPDHATAEHANVINLNYQYTKHWGHPSTAKPGQKYGGEGVAHYAVGRGVFGGFKFDCTVLDQQNSQGKYLATCQEAVSSDVTNHEGVINIKGTHSVDAKTFTEKIVGGTGAYKNANGVANYTVGVKPVEVTLDLQ